MSASLSLEASGTPGSPDEAETAADAAFSESEEPHRRLPLPNEDEDEVPIGLEPLLPLLLAPPPEPLLLPPPPMNEVYAFGELLILRSDEPDLSSDEEDPLEVLRPLVSPDPLR